MILSFQIDTTLPLSAQLDEIRDVLTPPARDAEAVDPPLEDEPDRVSVAAMAALTGEAPDTFEDEPPRVSVVLNNDGFRSALAAMATEQKRTRKPRPVPACFDGSALAAWLRANGPATMGQACKAFGMAADDMAACMVAVGAASDGTHRAKRYYMPDIATAFDNHAGTEAKPLGRSALVKAIDDMSAIVAATMAANPAPDHLPVLDMPAHVDE